MPATWSTETATEARRVLAAAGGWATQARFDRYYAKLFEGVSFERKRVLDIGGGAGTCSFLAVLGGAAEVVCLDPEGDGSTSGTGASFRAMAARLGVSNASIVPGTVQAIPVANATFDVIIVHNSINHFDEPACVELRRSATARATYRAIFEKLAALATPGAALVIADCTSSNIFPKLGLRHPVSPSIEWEKHQPPEVWAGLLEEVGFEHPVVRWTSYSRLGALGWMLTSNRFAAFLLTGHFMMQMRRRR